MSFEQGNFSSDHWLAETHKVENQPRELQDYNLFSQDVALQEWVNLFGADWANQKLTEFGGKLGQAEYIEACNQANQNPPVFQSHDRFGRRIDEIEFHPAYHKIIATSIEAGLHASPWKDPKKGAHIARSSGLYMQHQLEAGHCCPVTMTFASVPSIKLQPELAEYWLPKILNTEYQKDNKFHGLKNSATIGMAMTEKQGGSDVRANTTKAYPVSHTGPGQLYQLVGHKFFMSAPMCDAFLILAYTDGGLSCFLMPRWLGDGEKNAFQIQRLKNKMGNVSNASCEVEFRGAHAWMLGEEGRGVATIIEMVAMTRFDCMVGSSSLMRQAVAQITHHCHYRAAFGKKLIDQPLMQNLLADLIIEQEAALALTMRVGAALDDSFLGDSALNNADNDFEKLFLRIATPVGKYWICKRTPNFMYEAMEVIGGSGVMETCMMPRLYREAPINTIWEGSGNVQCLDVMRALAKSPACLDAFYQETEAAFSNQPQLKTFVEQIIRDLKNSQEFEFNARHIVDRMAIALQASVLTRFGQADIADHFCQSRMQKGAIHNPGTLTSSHRVKEIIERARPKV